MKDRSVRRKNSNTDATRLCPLCREAYGSSDIVTILQHDSLTVSHMTCPSCRASVISQRLTTSGAIMRSIGMTTDLSADDAKRCFARNPLSSDQLLESYAALREPTTRRAILHTIITTIHV